MSLPPFLAPRMDIRNFFKPPATPAAALAAKGKAAPTAKKELATSPLTLTHAVKKKVTQKRKRYWRK